MKSIDEIIERRRAVRIYDPEAQYDPKEVKECVRLATLAPSSSNMQLWEFYKVSDPAKRQKITEYCMNQSTARTANELVVVVVRKDKWRQRADWNLQKVKEQLADKKPEEYTKKEKRAINYFSSLIKNLYFDFLGIYGWLKYIAVWTVSWFRPVYWEVRASDVRIVAHKSAALAAQTFMLAMAGKGYDTCPMEGLDTRKLKRLLRLPGGAEINMVISCGKRKPEGVYHERRRVPFKEVYFEV